MTAPDDGLLTTTEGVDEGSAASTAEGPQSGAGPVDVGGAAPGAGPESGATPAPPVDMESDDARAARDAVGTGQQVQVGEG
jgi:hypothetical protein